MCITGKPIRRRMNTSVTWVLSTRDKQTDDIPGTPDQSSGFLSTEVFDFGGTYDNPAMV